MEHFTPWSSLLGGVLIGLASAMLFVGQGRIAGVMGIFNGLLGKVTSDYWWRLFFVVGLLLGGVIILHYLPQNSALGFSRPLPLVIIAGLLVGFGTRMGNGCTSGHGVCGLGRRSPRSLAAVLSFMGAGMLTVYLLKLVGV